ncbi:MAG: pyridoxal phosphate-dependent aminotransferase, partial [Deltaproteobacteria bacterium]|nr:pyridoxal phosphate-dependent aminotransferase [Deltaproteobacteria bacterium]
MEFSRRIVDVKTSATLKAKLKALELQAQGVRVINLSAGEPSFDTPEKIKQACQKALDENFTRYGPVNGILKLREAIQQKLKRISGVEVSPEAIVVACGAKQAIFSALFILLNEGDEVLLPVPYWVTYPAQIKLAGGRPVFMPTDESTGFKITPKHLKKAVTDKTRMLILNSPANPTGSCYTGEELTALGKICSDKNIWVLSDEIYDEITFDGFQHVSFLKACPFHQERTILINGASKAYAMTGWRMGYAAGPLEFVEKLKILQGQEITSIPTFIQHACVTAFNDCDEEVKKMRA